MPDTRAESPSLPTLAGLSPLVAIVSIGFLAIGAPLPVLPLYVHTTLGFGTAMAGWVVGIQSLATVLTRHRAGTLCDRYGPRRSVLTGLPLASLAGLGYLAAALLPLGPDGALAILLAARLLLGVAESLFLTGCMTWGIARLGPARTGKVMSWQGIALYVSLGLGAPLGLWLQTRGGFQAVAVLAIAAPLAAFVIAICISRAPGAGRGIAHVGFLSVLRLIWQPGTILALSTLPFGGIASFIALHFQARGWAGAGLALSAFAAGFVGVRLAGSHVADRFGAMPVAVACLAVEAAGQALLWLAPHPAIAAAGCLLTGAGFSLMFPAMGVQAMRRVGAEQRGRAVGNFTAFFDIALGTSGPVLGFVAAQFGTGAVFGCGLLAVAAALGLLAFVGRAR